MNTKEKLESMTEADWLLVLEKGTNLQLMTLVKSYKKIIDRYQNLCGELYQVLGALDAPAYVLDRVSDASSSMVVSNTPSLLPFDPHAWLPSKALNFEEWAKRELGLSTRRIASGDYGSFGMACAEKAWKASRYRELNP